MRKWTIIYSVVAIWTFGWLAGVFGVGPSLFAFIILFAPAFFAWRMLKSERVVKRREYWYLGIVSLAAVIGTIFIVGKWYESGVGRLAMFNREYHAFRRQVSSMPEYKNVKISYIGCKGVGVGLNGHVANQDVHDRLLQIYESMVRNADFGCWDDVDYPGKPSDQEDDTSPPNENEKTDESMPDE